tara:strand:- start:62 stop:802 length:741 start_codon:yes stop_codon:yes gene_type:complete
MSKFSKRKNKTITNYEKCPSLQLFNIAHFLSNFHYIGEEIDTVYLVDDTSSKVVIQNQSMYLTTGHLFQMLRRMYSLAMDKDEHGNLTNIPKYTYVINGESKEKQISSHSHYGYYGSENYRCNMPLAILDMLFYMKELGKTSIKCSMPVKSVAKSRVGYSIKFNHKFNTDVCTIPLISERLEKTRIKNELLALHHDKPRCLNEIKKRDCSVNKLIDKYGSKKIEGDNRVCKIENLFLELGGMNYVS